MTYDIAVIGAGPAGLMAAKRAAEKGLKTVIVEKQKNVGIVKRCCCMNFILDDPYMGESAYYKDRKMIFPKNGFEVEYRGRIRPIYHKYYLSPSGHRLRFVNSKTGKPIVYKFDKGFLLKSLWDECVRLGVSMQNETVAYNASDFGSSVEIDTVRKNKRGKITAKKAILADGVNSRISASIGLNEGRTYFVTALVAMYELENVKNHPESSWVAHYGKSYFSNAPIFMETTLDDNIVELSGPPNIYEDFAKKSRLAGNFEGTKIVKKTGCSVKAQTSMKKPYKGNFVAIGDAAAFVEVEVQGALMCGYRVTDALCDELDGKNGLESYARWWMSSFEFNSDEFIRVAQGYALVPTYTDDELDYLFSLAENTEFEGTFSQYKTPRLMWDAFLSESERIKKEKPALHEKIQRLNTLTLKDSIRKEI